MGITDHTNGTRDARWLRAQHVPGRPLLLANAWDPPSARAVAEAGLAAVATSSAAVAASLGFPDGGKLPPSLAFEAVSRIAAAVDIPVTADIEDGYGLAADELVERLIEAGACGCNVEDTDHQASGLVDAGRQADRLAAFRAAAGERLVLNARVDVWLHGGPADEGLARARRYRDAGADCVYPIGLSDLSVLREMVDAVGPVNALLTPRSPTLADLTAAGVARVSLGGGLWRIAMRRATDAAAALKRGADAELWR